MNAYASTMAEMPFTATEKAVKKAGKASVSLCSSTMPIKITGVASADETCKILLYWCEQHFSHESDQ